MEESVFHYVGVTVVFFVFVVLAFVIFALLLNAIIALVDYVKSDKTKFGQWYQFRYFKKKYAEGQIAEDDIDMLLYLFRKNKHLPTILMMLGDLKKN